MNQNEKKDFLRLAKDMYDKFGQECVVISYKDYYRYFNSIEKAKLWAKDIGAFNKTENEYDFDIVVSYID